MRTIFTLLIIFLWVHPGNAQQQVAAVFVSDTLAKNDVGSDSIPVSIEKKYFDLKEITINGNGLRKGTLLSGIDKQLRPLSSSQDLLRMVPGLFIAQHAGGGKAEQIFLRGFDVDHGTDFAIFVDGMPVNMTSHAHGQGYADLHFLIPETVKELEVHKGPYNARYGDLATSGAGEFRTFSLPDQNVFKLEYGMFNTRRAMLMTTILNRMESRRHEQMYIAGEYKYTDAFFNSKQHFNRANLLAKYSMDLMGDGRLELTASTFYSTWDASGQIPQRKIDDGSISRYGAIDDTEGGQTGRSNVNLQFRKPLKKGFIKSQLYYNRYDFNLYSNFTFFLHDSINGDQIQQGDHRNILGTQHTLGLQHTLFNKELNTTIGSGFRYDQSGISLLHTAKRQYLNDIVRGDLKQWYAWLYTDEELILNPALKLNAALRMDMYHFNFRNITDPLAGGIVVKALLSPKLNLEYTPNPHVQLFAKSGYGFHSNDARAVVVGTLENTLARAFGYEAGAILKPTGRLVLNAALWSLRLQSELVYVGDEGIVEIAGRTQRYGIDLGARYQLARYLFFDADLNYNKGRLIDERAGEDRIPLAPVVTSIGGFSYKRPAGLNGALRYRFMGKRPANESYSLTADGYFLFDALINYTQRRYQLGLSIENLFNAQWKEAQFATNSRLQNERLPVEEIHFTPGTPFFMKGSISIFF